MKLSSIPKKQSTIADLYPGENADEYAQIEFNLNRYLDLVWRIYERNKAENHGLLTENRTPANVKGSAG